MKLNRILPYLTLVAFSALGLPDTRSATAQETAILEISGAIGSCETRNRDGQCAARFTFEELRAIGMTTVKTVTPYTDGAPVFEGVLLRALLAHVGAEHAPLEMITLNDYRATIPAADPHDHDVLLALVRDGQRMSVRDRGPVWVIYPSRDGKELDVLMHDHKMVWQLSQILVLQ